MTQPTQAKKVSSTRRRALIVEAMEQHGRVEVTELSTRFGVAEETIRRDLKSLENAGKLQRAHGGAITAQPPMPTFIQPRPANSETEIARCAIGLVPETGTIFIGPGILGETLASILPNRLGLQVLTNSIPVALKASMHTNLSVYNLGGTVDPADGTQTGQWTREEALTLRLDASFIAPRGLSSDGYLTAPSPQLSSLLRTVIDATERTIILADRESLKNTGLVKVVPLNSVNDVIIGPESAGLVQSFLDEHETLIHIADESPEKSP